MIEWRRVPGPLWIFAFATFTGMVLIEIGAHGPVVAKALYAPVMLAWLFFLLRGVRWLWIATIVIYVLGTVPYLVSGSITLHSAFFTLLGLVLLLLPSTRGYFDQGDAERQSY